jgi:glycosidase
MRVHDDYKEGWNVAAQVDDPNSVFSFWQKLLKLRKEYEALVYGMSEFKSHGQADITGTFIPLDEKNEKTYSYIRHDKTIDQKLLVILNFSRSEPDSEGYYHGEKASFEIPGDIDISKAKLIITNGEEKEGSGLEGNKIELSEWEGRVYVL